MERKKMDNSLSKNSLLLLSTSSPFPFSSHPPPLHSSPTNSPPPPLHSPPLLCPPSNPSPRLPKKEQDDAQVQDEDRIPSHIPNRPPSEKEIGFDYENFEEVAQRVLNVRDKASLWALAGISTNLVSHLQSLDSISKFDDACLNLGELHMGELRFDNGGNFLVEKEENYSRNKEIALRQEGENLKNREYGDKDLLDNERDDEVEEYARPIVIEMPPYDEIVATEVAGHMMEEDGRPVVEERKEEAHMVAEIFPSSSCGESQVVSISQHGNEMIPVAEGTKVAGALVEKSQATEEGAKVVNHALEKSPIFHSSGPHDVSIFQIQNSKGKDDDAGNFLHEGPMPTTNDGEGKRELQLLTMVSGSSSSHGEHIAIPPLADHFDKKKQFSNYELVSWDFFTHGEVDSQKSSQVLNSKTHLAGNSLKEWMSGEWISGESSSHCEEFSQKDNGICGHKSSYDLTNKKAYDGHDTCTIQTIECGLLDTYGAGQVDIQGEETCRRLDSQQKYKEKINYDESLAKGDSGRKAMGFKWKTPSWLKQGTTQPRMQARRMIVTENSEIEERQSAGKITTESRKTTLIDDKNKYSLATNTTKMAPAHENSHAHKDTILEGFHTSSRRTLRFVAPESQHGIPIVKPKREVVEEGAKKWNTTAIGYLLGQKPYFYHLQSFARATWKGIKDIIVADNGFFLFIFDTEKRMEDVIQGGPWLFKGQPLFLQKWHPGMNLEMKKHRHVPVWVKLRNLPLEYWTTDGLSVVASGVGQPLYPDTVTKKCTRIDYARVCVLIDLEGPLPAEVVIVKPTIEGGVGGPCKIGIEYEWLPKKCSSCQEFGHVALKCPKKKKDNHSPTLQIYLPKKSDMTQPHQNKEEKRTMDKLKPRKVKQQWVPRAGTRPCPSPCNNRPQIEENHEDNPRGTRPTTRPCSQPCSSRVSPANFPNTTRPGTRPCSRPCSPRSSIPIGSGDIVLSNSFARLEDLEEDTNQCTTEDQSQGPKQCSPSIYAP